MASNADGERTAGGAGGDPPGASAHLRVLGRRLALDLGLPPESADEALLHPPAERRPALDALQALARAARRARATALDATLTADALLVALDGLPQPPAPGDFRRAAELVAAAFGVPLELQLARWVSVPGAPPDAPAVAAAASLALAYHARVRSTFAEALADQDPEGVHQMRVALRRMRVALRLLEREAPSPDLAAVRETVRALSDAAGAVRDCDVAVGVIESAVNDEVARAAALRAVARQRPAALAALRRHLLSRESRERAVAVAKTLAALTRDGAGERPLRRVVESAFAREVDRLERRLRADFTAPGAYHDVRRQVRRVRDAAEVFGTALRKAARAARARLQPVQSVLGRLNDLDVVDALLESAGGGDLPAARAELRRARFETLAQAAVPLALLAVHPIAPR